MRASLLRQLAELYERLDGALPGCQGNPCGDCNACCTGHALSRHNVTALELDYIEEKVGPAKLDAFRSFLKRDGQIDVCPYYENGCGIYHHRPYSCRVFGHYRREDTPLPEICVFRGQEHIFGTGRYQETVPEAESLVRLSRQYWAFRTPRQSLGDDHYQAAGVEDSLGRALDHFRAGDVASALSEMKDGVDEDPFSLYSMSLMLEEGGRPDLAVQALLRALEQAPECSDLWHRLGCTLFALGNSDGSEQAFRRTLEHHPEHGQAWGMLGLHRMMRSDYAEAVPCLQRAVDLGHDGFEARLGEARLALESAGGQDLRTP